MEFINYSLHKVALNPPPSSNGKNSAQTQHEDSLPKPILPTGDKPGDAITGPSQQESTPETLEITHALISRQREAEGELPFAKIPD